MPSVLEALLLFADAEGGGLFEYPDYLFSLHAVQAARVRVFHFNFTSAIPFLGDGEAPGCPMPGGREENLSLSPGDRDS